MLVSLYSEYATRDFFLEAAPQSHTDNQSDTFNILHVPVAVAFAVVLVFNPSTLIELGQTFDAIPVNDGWLVTDAIAKEFLRIRVDHIDKLGDLQVYSRTEFNASRTDFDESTNDLNRTPPGLHRRSPVNDVGQTRTHNQRALLHAFIFALTSRGLVKGSKTTQQSSINWPQAFG